jgi:serine kinase of HPr protein (carbohydrate metabolism regulator)
VIVHATAIARHRDGLWMAALLFGDSGSGKSDLALRALQDDWRLVSDDYTLVWRSGGRLWAKAPETIAHRIEGRGLGILTEPAIDFACVALTVMCDQGALERLPEPEVVQIDSVSAPCIRLKALESSALAKLDRALSTRALGAARR